MADFTALPVYGGAGDWHFNRYRVVFRRPPKATKQFLANDFVINFPQYLTSEYATVVRADKTFESQPTLHFHGYKMSAIPSIFLGLPGVEYDIAKPHTDWVAKIDDNDNLGFTAQTLKREFRDLSEDGPTRAADVVVTVAVPLLSLLADNGGENDPMEVNRMHFLAGRRSWRLDDGKNFEVDGDVMVLETTAVERFSHKRYVQADSVLGLQASIPDIWTAMLNNFVRMKTLVRVPQPLRPGWKNKDGFDYYVKSFANFESLAADAEFAQQKRLNLFKTLLPQK
jgi:hypothetical protein